MIDVVGYGQFSRQLPGMHDNNGMSASHGTRMSPGNSIQTLHPVAHEIHHTSVIKKLDHSVESFVPSSHHIQHNDNTNELRNDAFDSPDDTMIDDDFSDHDSHYSEDLEDIDMDLEPKRDMTKQLLDFATIVSSDIQKFFGRKKGEDDSCDIYEDKWTSTKSGRELYYADLMKIVHGEDKGNGKAGKSSPLLDISNSVCGSKDNRNSFTGKPDKKLGVGPLNELFEYGLRNSMTDKKLKHNKEIKRLKPESKKFQSVTPMRTRKLPTSFWKEPGSQSTNVAETRQSSNNSVLQSNNPPDFSDLLESWRLDRSEFSGDITSSSEVSMSPESV